MDKSFVASFFDSRRTGLRAILPLDKRRVLESVSTLNTDHVTRIKCRT